MIRDITIGEYYPSESFIHRLDPRVKLFATFVYIISLFLSKNLIGFAVAGVFLTCFMAQNVVCLGEVACELEKNIYSAF